PLLILWEQLINPLVLILIAAAVVSGVLNKWDSTIAIGVIVVLNAALGFFQEYRAEQAMAALKRMSAPAVRVRRGGRVLDVKSNEIVPGDIVIVEAGSIIPADGRVIESANLRVLEASLTGESLPVDKSTAPLFNEEMPLGDRHNMVYMGTAVTYGRGEALITTTGMKTELGKIATLIQGVQGERTPLQRRLDELGKVLLVLALVIIAVAFSLGFLRPAPNIEDLFVAAVAIAVAVVPEGLPAVVTIALALGAQRMLRRQALIRKLPAVETLGSVTVICSDKTGTLTENRMTVKVLDVAGHAQDVIEMIRQGHSIMGSDDQRLKFETQGQALLVAGAALCNDALLQIEDDNPNEYAAVGDPTEGALLVAAGRYGMMKATLDTAYPRVGEVPFESDRKRMTTVHDLSGDESAAASLNGTSLHSLLGTGSGEYVAFTKGSVDGLLDISTHIWLENRVEPLDAGWRERITASNDTLARNGLRVLGVAYCTLESLPDPDDLPQVENGLVFVGMVGMIDPPRPEVKDAVATSKTAGIRTVMITGDHPLTALSIAHDLGIARNDRVITGHELASMTPEQLDAVVEDVDVYARVAPEHKLNIVAALQKRGHVIAMTGDGVNDAPALRRANIGVAMGITGTAVSKEASDMVLLDDNFATIVRATEEGRTIYDNVRRFIKYILASNTGEVFVLLGTQAAGLPLPLNTLQILYMNLVTDGLPALALAVEPGEKDVMRRPPFRPSESLFARGMWQHLVFVGALIFGTSFALSLLGYPAYDAANHPGVWSTMVFTTLTLSQMGHALAVRSDKETLFSKGLFSNVPLLLAVGGTVLLQMAIIYVKPFQQFFGTASLTLDQLAVCLGLSLAVTLGIEIRKAFLRRADRA
ncbi:MAG: cation-translocating P-type ATPase, partial [Anaerolineae bacterium]|nr:cation-translocating P-type ATPase [Anaerolineae bacterium]